MKAEGRTIADLLKPRCEKAIPMEHPDLPYIGLEHVEAHTTRLLGSVPATEMRSTAKRFYSGDVLYSRLRPYLNKIWHADRDGLCSSEFIVLPGNESVDANFLRYRLNSVDFVSFANSLNAGDRPRVDFDQISSFCLPPFSLAAQRAAVAEIEKQFTRLEAGVAALRRVRANLKRYRAAVLKAACEGQLVPTEAGLVRERARDDDGHPGGVREISRGSSEANTPGSMPPRKIHPGGVAEDAAASGTPSGVQRAGARSGGVARSSLYPRLISASPPGFESGEQLLKRILAERRQHWTGRGQYKEPAAPDTANLPPLPADWTWATLGQLCRVQGGFAFKSTDYVKEGVPLVRISNLVNGRVQVSDDTVFLPPSFSEANLAFLLRKGDVLIAMSGATTGKMATMDEDIPALLNQRVGRFVLSSAELSNAKFISFLVMQISAKVLKEAYGAAQPNISPTVIEEMPVPVPPLAEQTRIVAEVERRLSVVEELESVVSANLQRATRLRQSILQKAFTGELTEQPRGDGQPNPKRKGEMYV